MVEQMDALDMTVEDLAEHSECVNCLGRVDEFGHTVEGWGDLCDMCWNDMLELHQHAAEIYDSRWG